MNSTLKMTRLKWIVLISKVIKSVQAVLIGSLFNEDTDIKWVASFLVLGAISDAVLSFIKSKGEL